MELVAVDEVTARCEQVLRRWMPYALAQRALSLGLTPGAYPPPRTWGVLPDFDRDVSQQAPAGLLVPDDVEYGRATVAPIRVTFVVTDRTHGEALRRAAFYAAAAHLVALGKPSLEGYCSGVKVGSHRLLATGVAAGPPVGAASVEWRITVQHGVDVGEWPDEPPVDPTVPVVAPPVTQVSFHPAREEH